jgi:hypothetical protein
VANGAGGYDVVMKVAPEAPFGRVPFTLKLRFESKDHPVETLRLFTAKGIEISRPRLDFGEIKPGRPAKTSLSSVLSRRNGPVRVLGVTSSDPRVRAAAKPLADGTSQFVTVKLEPGAPPGDHRGVIHVETDDPQQPLLEIEFHYLVAGD